MQNIDEILKSLIRKHSSPTVGKGDTHGSQPGYIIYDNELKFIVAGLKKYLQAEALAQDAVACTCSQAGFPSSCYNCDAEASDIVNALRKLYSTHPICAQAANYIERKLRDMATPSEPLQCLRCGTVDAFGPAARSPAESDKQ